MNIYVIIVTHNPLRWIDDCFTSLRESSISIKTIVVDNASTDGSQEIIKSKFPEVDFIQSDKNLGFGGANNIGIKKAYDLGADFVFLLNQDAVIKHDTIERIIKIHQNYTNYAILSPMQLADYGELVDKSFLNYISDKNYNQMLSDIIVDKNIKTVYPFPFINAATWSMSRRCIEEVGGFDPLFFHYGEDVDYCRRIIKKGFLIGVTPKIIAYHNREQNPKKPKINSVKRKYTSTLLIFKEREGMFFVVVLKYLVSSLKLCLNYFLRLRFKQIMVLITVNFMIFRNLKQIKNSRVAEKEKFAFLDF